MQKPARYRTQLLLCLALITFGMILPRTVETAKPQPVFERASSLAPGLDAPVLEPNTHSPWRQWLPATFRRRR